MIEQGVKRPREDEGDEGEGEATAAPEPKRLEIESDGNGTATESSGNTAAAPEAPPPAGGEPTVSEAQTTDVAAAGTDSVTASGDGLGSAVPEEQTSKTIGVPDGMVGKIIGKQGSTIRQIQDVSGAHMDIDKACEPGAFERTITITGTPSAIAKCEVSDWLPSVFHCPLWPSYWLKWTDAKGSDLFRSWSVLFFFRSSSSSSSRAATFQAHQLLQVRRNRWSSRSRTTWWAVSSVRGAPPSRSSRTSPERTLTLLRRVPARASVRSPSVETRIR